MKDYSNLSKEKLIQIIEKLENRKRYGLIWDEERVPEQVAIDCKDNLPVLEEFEDKEIITNENQPTHILIEGDNYHALSVLNYTHKGKVDIIYIDPPYNTGAKDWKYNNDYVDINDTWRHSKWVQFMYNRLILAKDLLRPSGSLICAIDHNEQENLGILLRELFGEKEITCVTIIHNPGGIQGKNFSSNHEYIYFVYPKGVKAISLQNRNNDPDIRPLRDVSTGNHLRTDAKNCFYPIYVKNEKIIGFGEVCEENFHPDSVNVLKNDEIIEIYPIDTNGIERKWVFARDTVESIKDDLFVEFNNQRKIWDIIRRKVKFNYKTVWIDRKFNANLFGTQLLSKIIDSKFPFPKSLYAVQECIEAIIHKKDAIILDYFAGSGTTGHAVLRINKKDNGNRKFILCTNNENNIAVEVTYPRLYNVIKGYKGKGKEEITLIQKEIEYNDLTNSQDLLNEIKKIKLENKNEYDSYKVTVENGFVFLYGYKKFSGKVPGLGNNLKYYKTNFVKNTFNQDQLKIDITKKCTEMLCIKEGIYNLVKEYTENNETIWKLYSQGKRFMGIYYDFSGLPLETLRIELNKVDGDKVLYCFTTDQYGIDNQYFLDWNNIRLEPIPQKILDVYKRIFRGNNR